MLYGLAASITGNVNPRHRHLLASCGHTHKRPLMCAAPSTTRHHLVPFSNHILNREMEIWEGAGSVYHG